MSEPTRAALDAAMAAVRAADAALQAALEHVDAAGDDPWLDMADAAKVAPVSKSTLERWAREGDLRAVTGERGKFITRRSWVDEALTARAYQPRGVEQGDDEPDEIAGKLKVVA